jgi:two-component system nitrate/nitrite response regulator NarL
VEDDLLVSAAHPTATAPRGRGQASVRLLLCDYHSIFVESLAVVLGEAGYDIVAATRSPNEMLAILRREPVDVCVVDVSCAPAYVLAELADLRALAPRMQVVLLSGCDDAALFAAATEHGVRGFAGKDQHVADVIDTIERVHGGEVVGPHPGPRGAAPDRQVMLGANLTTREREVLCRLTRGEDTEGVASSLAVTVATARSHIRNILEKLDAHSRVEAAATAVRHGLVDAETGEWLRH